MADEPRVLAVVGVGLIGQSVILAARRRWPAIEIRGLDREDGLDRVAGADVVVLAMPVDAIIAALPRVAALAQADALVMDTGSTKHAILAAADAAGLAGFVGGHPMAGGASSGPGHASADLFEGRPWFLIGRPAAPEPLARASRWVEALGARAVTATDGGRAHDRLMAAVSHLPQVTASVLMTIAGDAAGPEGLAFAGPGLRDTTRLASSSADVWESILSTNGGELRPLIRALAARLADIADRLDDGDAVRRLFDSAARLKASCL